MKRNQEPLKDTFIFAVNSDCDDPAGELAMVQAHMNGHPVKQVHGKWDGVTEFSYVVCCNPGDFDVVNKVKAIAARFKQDCILYLDPERKAYLLFAEDNYSVPVFQGYFKPCTMSQAYKKQGYTFDPMMGQHYIVEDHR